MRQDISLEDMRSQMFQLLKQGMPDYDVIDGYSEQQYFGSLEKPMLNVGIRQIQTQQGSFSDYFGFGMAGDTTGELQGIQGKVEFLFSVQFPITSAGKRAEDCFLELFHLLRSRDLWEVTSFHCGEMKFLDQYQLFSLEITAEIQILLLQHQEQVPIRTIEVSASCSE